MFAVYRCLQSMYDDLHRCTDCCKGDYTSFHCPLCPVTKYKPRSLGKVKKHLEVHWKTKVEGKNGLHAVICHLTHGEHPDIKKRHYHCPICQKIITQKVNMEHHVNVCKGQIPSTSVQGKQERENRKQNDSINKKVPCDICGKSVHIRWLKAHKRVHRRSSDIINENRHHHTVVVSAKEGIFCSIKNLKGPSFPVHIIKRTSGENTESLCDNHSCNELKDTAKRGNNVTFECPHLLSTPYAVPGKTIKLKQESLSKMKDENFITDQRYQQLMSFKNTETSSPLIVDIPPSEASSERYIFLSVFTGTTHYWSKVGRTVVTFDKCNNVYTCRCSPSRRYCLHKAVAKWFIFQEHPHFFSSSVEIDNHDNDQYEGNFHSDHNDGDEDRMTKNAPQDQFTKLNTSSNLSYIQSKQIPPNLPQNAKHPKSTSSVTFSPLEMNCHQCHGKLLEETSTTKGKVVTMTRVVKDITTYWKICPQCRCSYMYQEWIDGYHNFNNKLILGLDVCLFLRAGIQNHVALGRSIAVLEEMLEEKLNTQEIVNAYLHFEAMTDHSYDFNCVICGHHPSILIWDTFRKARFRFTVSDLKVPDSKESPEMVDADIFWDKIEKNILCRGIDEAFAKQIAVQPDYENWAPWIGRKSRCSNRLYNTEVMKCWQPHGEEIDEAMPEEVLSNLLMDEKITNIRRICKEIGVKSDGSRIDMIMHLRQMSVSRSSFDKAYEKVFGCTGGWAVGCCRHGIVYAIKNLLRSESPRDYIDLEASLKHRPNVSVCDIAHLLASHANKRFKDFFTPHQGRLDEANEDTIAAVESGDKLFSLPCLSNLPECTQHNENEGQNYNPCTGADIHLALFDWFHELNCKKRVEILRRSSLLKEICGVVDTQAVEQLFSSSKRDIYFMNNFTPANHMFLFRLIYHLRNTACNKLVSGKQEKAFGESLRLNRYGQLTQSFHDNKSPNSDEEDQSDPSEEFNKTEEIFYTARPVNQFEDAIYENNESNENYQADQNIETNDKNQFNQNQVCQTEYHLLMKYHTDEFRFLQELAEATFSSLTTSTKEEGVNFQRNLQYANRILFQSATEDRHTEVCTLSTKYGLFQSQGHSNYCGLCCVNNAIGIPHSGPVVQIVDMDEVADKLWLDMVYNPCFGLTTMTIEAMRDREGFYSYEVIQCILQHLGFNLLYLDNRILEDVSNYEISSRIIHELQTIYGESILIIRLKSFQHWLSIKVQLGKILLFDSRKRNPVEIDHNLCGQYIRENIHPPGAVLFLVPVNTEKMGMVDGVVSTTRLRRPLHSDMNNTENIRVSNVANGTSAPDETRESSLCENQDDGQLQSEGCTEKEEKDEQHQSYRCSSTEEVENNENDSLPVPPACLSHKDLPSV